MGSSEKILDSEKPVKKNCQTFIGLKMKRILLQNKLKGPIFL